MANDFLFTSESVTEGHPDKICDQISDAILDSCLSQDPNSRVACECLISKDKLIIAGEITSQAKVDFEKIARQAIKNIGYDNIEKGLDYKKIKIEILLNNQSADIAMGVNEGQGKYVEQGAGDQGMMFGYASDDTEVYMPMPIYCAHLLSYSLAKYRKQNLLDYLMPDGKTQVTVEYRNNQPNRINTVIISTQHKAGIDQKQIEKDMIEMASQVLPKHMLDSHTIYHINPTGQFIIGGPLSDCGLTGRKIIVDSYGGMGRHGGGAFSGKDPTKVDRSAAYMARYLAKNIVAAKIASECEVQLSYAIGYHKPISVSINTFGTSKISETMLAKMVRDVFPLTPKSIIEKLDLKRAIYYNTASYGHFGRELKDFSWENIEDFNKILKI